MVTTHPYFKINYAENSEAMDFFPAITTACTFLENTHAKELEHHVFLNDDKGVFLDLENVNISIELLDVIGHVLENVRIIILDDMKKYIMGGGCNVNKCKHRIMLRKIDYSYIVLSVSDIDMYCIDCRLKNGIYAYQSNHLFCKVVSSIICSATMLTMLTMFPMQSF